LLPLSPFRATISVSLFLKIRFAVFDLQIFHSLFPVSVLQVLRSDNRRVTDILCFHDVSSFLQSQASIRELAILSYTE
jgi:hypothetical protein